MNMSDYERNVRIHWEPKTLQELAQQIQDLRYTLNSAVQDLVVLKDVLEKRGLMDEALYKELRTTRMLRDHSGRGANPWVDYSIYPYTLDEKIFLRKTLNSSEAEVKQFEEDADNAQQLT